MPCAKIYPRSALKRSEESLIIHDFFLGSRFALGAQAG